MRQFSPEHIAVLVAVAHKPPTPFIIDIFHRVGWKRNYWILEVILTAIVWTEVMTWPLTARSTGPR